MLIVLVVIGILMAATMRFGSGRIVDLKAQSLKEQFIWYYNSIYSQNMTSSFRNGVKYQTLIVTFATWVAYHTDNNPYVFEPNLSDIAFREFVLDNQSVATINLHFTPYILWCPLVYAWHTGNKLTFQLYVPQNGKQYCFEIKSETCKLIETKCN